MRYRIHSTIVVDTEGSTMRLWKKKGKDKARQKKHSPPREAEKEERQPAVRSAVESDASRLFHQVRTTNDGVTQNVNVEVNIEQADDCLTSCIGALASCFGKGAAGA